MVLNVDDGYDHPANNNVGVIVLPRSWLPWVLPAGIVYLAGALILVALVVRRRKCLRQKTTNAPT
ncbi:MAG TPA: hypothetical protein VKK79_10155 [Candidatus Lokiarchaeia archaeon]|nr:hypothetical protein [Candidatus Lokiarchaeia archaeon]